MQVPRSPANLDPLVGVAHHGDEQVDEDDDGDEEVDEKDELEERDGPVLHVIAQPEVLRAGEAEEAEDQQVEGLRDRHGVTCKIVKCDDDATAECGSGSCSKIIIFRESKK